jgi:hypothetical protein
MGGSSHYHEGTMQRAEVGLHVTHVNAVGVRVVLNSQDPLDVGLHRHICEGTRVKQW